MRDITGITVNCDMGAPRYKLRYAFEDTSTLGKDQQFPELSSEIPEYAQFALTYSMSQYLDIYSSLVSYFFKIYKV